MLKTVAMHLGKTARQDDLDDAAEAGLRRMGLRPDGACRPGGGFVCVSGGSAADDGFQPRFEQFIALLFFFFPVESEGCRKNI